MDRSFLLALASAGAGILSFSTFPLRASASPLAHLAENATWGLIVGAVVLALLAADGVKGRRAVKALLGLGVASAAVRASLLFAP